MLRVLMVLEDYGELMFLQTVLKKIGFDVDAIQNPRQFQDSLLSMNPDLLVMTAHGKKVKGTELIRTVKRVRGLPKVVLIRGSHAMADEGAGADAWIDSPVGAMSLLNVIGDVCGLNKDMLADKFAKLRLQEVGTDEARVLKENESGARADDMERSLQGAGHSSSLEGTSLTTEQRQDRYQKFLKVEVPIQEGFSVKQVQDQVKNLRRAESPEDLAELERQRRAFVEHLFRKKT